MYNRQFLSLGSFQIIALVGIHGYVNPALKRLDCGYGSFHNGLGLPGSQRTVNKIILHIYHH